MKRFKRFNEVLKNEEPKDDVLKFKEFSDNRLGGATKIANNAEEKGGDALLTYHHFKVKLPYYKKASEGKFDPKLAQEEYKDLVEELVDLTKNSMNIKQTHFQELMGKIEVVGELLIKHQDL